MKGPYVVNSTDAQVPIPSRLYTTGAAAYTGIPVSTLRYWRHNHTGPASYSIGARVVYDIADLDAWVTAQKAATVRGGVSAPGGAA